MRLRTAGGERKRRKLRRRRRRRLRHHARAGDKQGWPLRPCASLSLRKNRAKKQLKKAGGKSSTGLKKVENILVPGINPKKGDMKCFLAEQQRIWG